MPNLKILNLGYHQIIGDALQHLHGLPLTSLKLCGCVFSNLIPLEGHATLEKLDLSLCSLKAAEFNTVNKIPHLKTLILSSVSFTEKKLRNLSGSSIGTLSLNFLCFSGETIKQLVINLPNLTTLHFCDVHSFYIDQMLLGLRGASLKTLSLNRCHIGDKSLKKLKGLALERLNLVGCKNVTDKGIRNLQGLPLTSLNVSSCTRITALALQYMQAFEKLSELSLDWCERITDDGFLNLVGLPIKKLRLRICRQLTDNALKNFKGLPLKELNLFACKNVTDVGLKYLVGHSLEKLNICDCERVTDEGITYLKKHSRTRIHIKRYRFSETDDHPWIPNLKFVP